MQGKLNKVVQIKQFLKTSLTLIVTFSVSHIYAELGAYMPDSGGDYAYEKRALGRPFSFLFIWVRE